MCVTFGLSQRRYRTLWPSIALPPCACLRLYRCATQRAYLTDSIQEQLHISVPASAIVQQTSVQALCSVVRLRVAVSWDVCSDWPQVASPSAPRPQVDWQAESRLPDDLPMPTREAKGTTVLLTGGTGFCGVFILAELLATTKRNVCVAPMRVLIRRLTVRPTQGVRGARGDRRGGPGASGSQARSVRAPRCVAADVAGEDGATLQGEHSAHYCACQVAGDIALPRWGLTPERWRGLAQEVAAIVHCGATVNVLQSYARTEPVALSCRRVVRAFH